MNKHLRSYISNILVDRLKPFKLYTYYHNNFKNNFHINCDNKELSNKRVLDLVTISFNNEYVISYQIRLLKKNILERYSYTVIDNSTDFEQQNKICELCKRFGVGYVRAPENPYANISPSLSHGVTLNWIYKNYLKTRGANFLGIIDHDVFPIKPTRVTPYLKDQYIYGHLQERKGIWYLWPGFCFFNFDLIKDKNINFMPNNIADTGGQNYYSIYFNLEKKRMIFPKHSYAKFREGDCPQSDLVEYIGDWMHTFNASGWKNIKNKSQKDQLVKNLLEKYLKIS